MTEPSAGERDSAPASSRAAIWLVLLLMLVAGLVLYAFYGHQVQPLIDPESAR